MTVAARKRGDGLANPSKLDAAVIGVRGAVADWRRVAYVAGEGGEQGVEEYRGWRSTGGGGDRGVGCCMMMREVRRKPQKGCVGAMIAGRVFATLLRFCFIAAQQLASSVFGS